MGTTRRCFSEWLNVSHARAQNHGGIGRSSSLGRLISLMYSVVVVAVIVVVVNIVWMGVEARILYIFLQVSSAV